MQPPTNGNPYAWILDEIADLVASTIHRTVGTDLFVGELPEPHVNGVPPSDGLYLVQLPSGQPDQYIDTETITVQFWSSSSDTKTGYELLRNVFNIFQRKANYAMTNWYVYFSYANGNIIDEGRGAENNKLFSINITFICRNLNNIS